jgi:hypothetical protein
MAGSRPLVIRIRIVKVRSSLLSNHHKDQLKATASPRKIEAIIKNTSLVSK